LEPLGSILKVCVSSTVLAQPQRYQHKLSPSDPFRDHRGEVVMGTLDDRVEHYKNIILDAFAKKQSVALFAPTSIMAEYIAAMFQKFPKPVFLLHGKLSRTKVKVELERMYACEGPSLAVGTHMRTCARARL